MNLRRCLRIAERLQLPFEQHTGIAIDPQRMVADGGYAMDVLTVCEADRLRAALTRLAVAEPAGAGDTEPMPVEATGWGAESTGFDSTRTQPANSAFDEARKAARAARRSPAWMMPGRWLGSDS